MIPAGHQIEKCEYGHVFSELVMESNRPVIHHSKATCDSRDGPLATYMLATGNCEHVKYFSGTEFGLIRCTVAPMRKSTEKVHFVSVDLVNEYLATLFGTGSCGKSLDSFVSSKNSLNCDQRGSMRHIEIQPFRIAFHIYLNALKYDPEIGFGCTKCPTELAKGEHEDDFDDIEIHISDGVDMGCQDNITKGRIS